MKARNSRGMTLPTPPVVPGIPLAGNALALHRNPVEFLAAAYDRFGSPFTIHLGPRPAAVFIEPEHTRLFFEQCGKALTTKEVYKFLVPMFGRVLSACPHDEYVQQKRLLVPAFQQNRMQTYVEEMVRQTERLLAEMGDQGDRELWDLGEGLALSVAIGAVMGPTVGRPFASEFSTLFRHVADGMEILLPPNLPFPRFIRRNRARRKLFAAMRPLIEETREKGGRSQDFFHQLAVSRLPDGAYPAIDTICGLTLLLISAAFMIVAAQASWCVTELIGRPIHRDRLIAEHRRVLNKGMSDIDAVKLDELTDTEAFILECIRLRPATSLLCRYVSSSIEVGGYTIPQGWLAMVCPSVSQRLDSAYDDAGTFYPERFSDASPASVRSAEASLLAFGGGMQRCLGQKFAVNELKILLVGLLERFDLSQYPETAKPYFAMGMTRPAAPHRIRYRKIRYRRGTNDGKIAEGDDGRHHQESTGEDRKVAGGMGERHEISRALDEERADAVVEG